MAAPCAPPATQAPEDVLENACHLSTLTAQDLQTLLIARSLVGTRWFSSPKFLKRKKKKIKRERKPEWQSALAEAGLFIVKA